MNRLIEIGPEQTGNRLDRVIVRSLPDISRTLIQKLISDERITTNGKPAKPSDRMRAGDLVSIDFVLPPGLSAIPEDIELTVIYEDESLAVIDKPAGMVVHPAPGHSGGTLVNGLLRRFPQMGGAGHLRPGLVHRLDKDTSGLMVVALSASAQVRLSAQIKQRTVKREYIACVSGRLSHAHFTVDIPVGRDPTFRRRMAAGPNTIGARNARTHVVKSEAMGALSLVHLKLDTGRTHQIRVHMSYIGHPIAGDTLYGGPALPGLERQFLHATKLELTSPVTGQVMRFESPLPFDLQVALNAHREHARQER